MTPASWKKLAIEISARLVVCGPVPGLVARSVLLAMVYRLAGGGAARTPAELGQELGVGERAMKSGIEELKMLGLVWLVKDPADARRRLASVNEGQVKAWARGEYVPAGSDGDAADSEIGDEKAGFYAGDSKADVLQNAGHPRVRASSSSSSSTSSFSYPSGLVVPASSPESSEAAFAEHVAMLGAMKHWGISTATQGAKEYVWRWVEPYSVEQVAWAAQASWLAGARNVNYMESVLKSEESRRLYPGNLSEFADFRGVRPWHFAPKDETEGDAR